MTSKGAAGFFFFVLMCLIVSVSSARSRFYRLSASRSASLCKAQNVFLSLAGQSPNHVLEDASRENIMVCASLCECASHVHECLPIINVGKE